jgi:hypothetical protein
MAQIAIAPAEARASRYPMTAHSRPLRAVGQYFYGHLVAMFSELLNAIHHSFSWRGIIVSEITDLNLHHGSGVPK